MDHDLELIIPDPGNIWKFDFYNFPTSWKYWKSSFSNVLISWKYWKLKSSTFSIVLEVLEMDFSMLVYPGNIDNRFFLFCHILEILELDVFYFVTSWKCWKLKSSAFSIILEILQSRFLNFPTSVVHLILVLGLNRKNPISHISKM